MQDDMAYEYQKYQEALNFIKKSIDDYMVLDADFSAHDLIKRIRKIVKDALS